MEHTNNVLIKALVGSRLHGLHNDSSDYDYKGVVISPLRDIISPFKTQKGKDSVTETEDNCWYEFQHFAKLMAQCNPTVLEVLWANHFETLHPLGKELVEGRHKLLHREKIFYAHRGYASDQRKKMELDDPNEYRTAKAIVSYFRIMNQGRDLLETGTFDPVVNNVRNENYVNFLREIKFNFNPKEHIPIVLKEINILEWELENSYNNCKIEFKPDIPWIEDLLERAYLELGKGT